jgi:hypothetical protein
MIFPEGASAIMIAEGHLAKQFLQGYSHYFWPFRHPSAT